MWVNSADDFINPPELTMAQTEVKRLKKGRFILVPASEQTYGHGTHTHAAVWQEISERAARGIRPMRIRDALAGRSQRGDRLGVAGHCRSRDAGAEQSSRAEPGRSALSRALRELPRRQVARAPARAALEQMSQANIRFALTTGSMKQQAANLTPDM